MRRGGTGFLLGYVLVEFVYAVIDIIKFCFELIFALVRLLIRGADTITSTRDAFEANLKNAIEPHIATLIKKRRKLLVTDDYGKQRIDRWVRELNYFINEVLLPRLDSIDAAYFQRNFEYAAQALDNMIVDRDNLEESKTRRGDRHLTS